ncbi:MAG TPA: cytochrome c oxidase subunit II [Acidimicrobiales bacterium]|nr:cytochrome c oxidase subunit II [Acidimicrobiales bacterium]
MRHRAARLAAVTAALAGLAACGDGSALAPKGPDAREIAGLWWLMFWLGLAVYVFVVALLFVVLRKRGKVDEPVPATPREGRGLIWGAGVGMTTVIIVVLVLVSYVVGGRIYDRRGTGGLRVEVVGYKFWWEVRYLDRPGAITANEIHIPTGRPVDLVLTSRDVIHSFWVPELAGKLDLVPGVRHVLSIQADRPGEFRGACAEYCGVQHANMLLLVVAQPPDEFEAWLDRQAQPRQAPADPLAQRGEEVFLRTPCGACHRVRGTPADADVGPDLTHFATRRTLGAGVRPNTRGHLGGWLSDPQAIKPGNLMPPTKLAPDELLALLAYMESLT